jgi:hypothetical protein
MDPEVFKFYLNTSAVFKAIGPIAAGSMNKEWLRLRSPYRKKTVASIVVETRIKVRQ